MALTKNNVNIPFYAGVDEKTDPFQVQTGKFLALNNSVFTKGGLLQKRNGFKQLPSLPTTANYLTTFNGNLIAIGSTVQAYSQGTTSWVNQGSLQPVRLNTLPMVRSSTAQTQCDAAVSTNGITCVVYTDQIPSGGSNVPTYKFALVDSTTGQYVVQPTILTQATSAPRVFYNGRYFIIVFGAASNNLRYIAVNSMTLAIGSITVISSQYAAGSGVAFDGAVNANTLFLSWNGTDGGGAIRMASISATLTLSGATTFAGRVATLVSVSIDSTQSTPTIWTFIYDSASSTGYVIAISPIQATVLAPTEVISSGTVSHITAAGQNGILTLYYEVHNNYTYDATIRTDYITKNTVTVTGTVGSPAILIRGLGLASKAFVVDSVQYLLTAYSSSYQPTFFLINSAGAQVAKLAYSNGGGYISSTLPSVTITDTVVQTSFLYKDLIQAANKDQGVPSSTGVYSQTGVNLATFTLEVSDTVTSELGGSVALSGGFLWMYDGTTPVEQGFALWPDSVEVTGSGAGGHMTAQQYYYYATYEWADNAGNVHRSAPSVPVSFTILTPPATITGNRTSGSAIISAISSTANLQAGQAVSGTGIPSLTTILSVDSSTQITLTNTATSGTSTSTVITPLAATSATINVPTLRVTYKKNVKIVVYRWSVAQQIPYQTTSLVVPTLNDQTVDSVAITDSNADSSILGNNILYTEGGVIEDIGPPATDTMTIFKSRLFLVDAEDRNLLWYSKQVIEATPVEMSDLFTIYVSPTIGAQGNTGPITALAAMDDKLIIFKRNAIYYIAGDGPDNVGANGTYTEPQFITATVGCADQHSIVMTPEGLQFQSDKGIWLLDRGLGTSYIGAPVENNNDSAVLSALTIPGTNQVRFTVDNNLTLMYDYYYKQWGTFTGISGVSSTLYQDLHTFINSRGEVYQENPGSYVDGASPVLLSFTTNWVNLMGVQGFQRAYEFFLMGTYLSPHKLAIGIAYDYAPSPTQSFTITPDNYSPAWGGDPVWGGGSPWGGSPSLEQWRIPFARQKCQSFQITLNELYDGSFGVAPGAGLTLSGVNLIIGAKKAYTTLRPSRTTG